MDNQKLWYVVNTYSGHESKVKEKLEMRINSMNMQDNIFRVIVPEQREVEVKDGVSKEKVRKMFPGYVLIEMVMSDEAWFIVRNTPGVTGFVGSHGAGSKPSPLLEEEMNQILGDVETPVQRVELNVKVGDYVEIVEGAFSGLNGSIVEIDQEHQKLKVLLEMFGRETEAEIEFHQVKKQDI